MELRRATRYRVRSPVLFQWVDAGEVQRQAGGFTRDISTSGVFVISEVLPPVGKAVAYELMLPPLQVEDPSWRLKATGRVVRHDAHGFGGTGDFGREDQAADEAG